MEKSGGVSESMSGSKPYRDTTRVLEFGQRDTQHHQVIQTESTLGRIGGWFRKRERVHAISTSWVKTTSPSTQLSGLQY